MCAAGLKHTVSIFFLMQTDGTENMAGIILLKKPIQKDIGAEEMAIG